MKAACDDDEDFGGAGATQAPTVIVTVWSRASSMSGIVSPARGWPSSESCGPPEARVTTLNRLTSFGQPWQMELKTSGRTIELRSNPMPDGGMVATWTDITERVEAADQQVLERRRVQVLGQQRPVLVLVLVLGLGLGQRLER
eukprot:gene60120-82256_t